MASTNKTTNYELSQFLGTDKPSWLGDYNSDMGKIDTAVHTVASTATGADGKADANATAIGTLSNLTTDAKTNLVSAVNEVDAHADSATTTAGQALSSATTAQTNAGLAQTAVANLASKFDLTPADLTVSCPQVTPTASATTVKCAKNSDGSLCKIYGRIRLPSGYNGNCVCTTSDTGLRPTEAITISGAGLRIARTSTGSSVFGISYTINTNGTITITVANDSTFNYVDVELIACLIFVSNFGDTPE